MIYNYNSLVWCIVFLTHVPSFMYRYILAFSFTPTVYSKIVQTGTLFLNANNCIMKTPWLLNLWNCMGIYDGLWKCQHLAMAKLQTAELITSQQGGQQVLHKDYRYWLNVKVAMHWNCEQKGCKGRCSTMAFFSTPRLHGDMSERGHSWEYKDNPQVQSHIRRTTALPLLPLELVQDA